MHTMHSSRMSHPVVLSRRYFMRTECKKGMRSHVLESTFVSFTHSLLRYFILPHLVEDCRARKTACLPPHAAARASSRAPGSSSGATQPRLLHSSPFHSKTPCFFFFYCLSLSLSRFDTSPRVPREPRARALSLSLLQTKMAGNEEQEEE